MWFGPLISATEVERCEWFYTLILGGKITLAHDSLKHRTSRKKTFSLRSVLSLFTVLKDENFGKLNSPFHQIVQKGILSYYYCCFKALLRSFFLSGILLPWYKSLPQTLVPVNLLQSCRVSSHLHTYRPGHDTELESWRCLLSMLSRMWV